MERRAHIVDGIVENVAVFDPENTPDGFENWIPCGVANPGWAYDGSVFIPPTSPPPSTDPKDYPLKRWQFHAMIDMLGKRTAIESVIEGLSDPTARAVATAKLKHSHEFNREDPLVISLSAAVGMTSDELDAAWMQAKELA